MTRRRQLHDAYFRRAKRDGYLARSAFKLAEINERKRLIRPRDRVLDLGCAPGSWLQVASELVGPEGRVVGIDLQAVTHAMEPNVVTTTGDFTEIDPETLVDAAGGPFDVVVSDMAPKTSGHGDDHLSVRLCRAVLERLAGLLRPGGHLAMKVFEGAEHPALLAQTRALFAEARAFKPRACRDASRETYLVAKGFRPPGPGGRADGARA